MEEKLHGTMMFKLAIAPLDDGVLLEIETMTKPGYAPEVYRGAFAGLDAIENTVLSKVGKFFYEPGPEVGR